MRRWVWLAGLVVATVTAALPADAGRGEPVTVFGAASLADALSEIGALYRAHPSRPSGAIRFSFAASSTLARQIEAGAPAGIFASASERWMDYLAERGLIDTASRISPIGNTLVLIAPGDSTAPAIRLDPDTGLAPLLGSFGRLAMGDPAHVPAGTYARQALQTLDLWDSLQTRLAYANDVRGVLALVERGEAPLGVVYATDAAISKRIRVLATFPSASHDPIRYAFALVGKPDSPNAATLLAFLSTPPALDVFRRYGFAAP